MDKSARVLVDLSTFSSTHAGGKDEVAYNLLRGFSQLGLVNSIVCVAKPEVERIVKSIDKNYCVIKLNRWKVGSRIGPILSIIPDIVYGIRLNRVVKKNQIGCVLYTNKFVPCKKLSCRTVVIPHDIQCFRSVHELHRWTLYNLCSCLMTKKTFNICDNVIAISKFDQMEMKKYLHKYEDKVNQIYNPIRFKDIIVNEHRDFITAINIQWEQKNVITLVKAFSLLCSSINEKLVLVGRKPLSKTTCMEIDKIIRQNELEDRVIFTGFVNEDELERIIKRTRIYINPSLFEGFGMTAVEMMGSRIPTIVSKCTALPESTLGICRYYEPATDEKALALEIEAELKKPIIESDLLNIQEKIRSKYDYIKISCEYWNFLTMEKA